MLALRYAALVTLVVWIGGIVALGSAVAPALFEVLGPRGVEGQGLAADVFGETLRRFHLITYACGATIIASLAVRAVLGPRPRRFAIRLLIAAAMVTSSAWAGLVVEPQMTRVRREIGTSPSALPEGDSRRAAFGRLHTLSTALALVQVLGGLVLVGWEMRD